jgi:SAM-dependent methyltransferase
MSTFDRPEALAINKARLDHLGSLGLALASKRVLEVGAGVGKLTSFWERKRCTVVSTDGRAENVKAILEAHAKRKVHVADLNVPGSHAKFGRFDIVFCYGVLYHTANPALVLTELAHVCDGLLLVETLVWPIDDGEVHPVSENRALADQSLDGYACRPARDWVMAQLRQLFDHVYVPKTQPAHDQYPLSWPAPEGDNVRAVFVASRHALSSDALSSRLLVRYARLSL